MPGRPLISVVVFVLNAADTIERALSSVDSADQPPVELLVMDGGSTDGTIGVIRRHESAIAHWRSRDDGSPTIALNEAEPAIEPNAQKSTKKTTSKGAEPVKTSSSKTGAITEEEKRLARNAALREWRRQNKDRVKAYMTEWRTKRSGKKPEELTQASTAAPAVAATKSASKRAPSQKAKPSKVAKKSKRKKGARA